MAQEILGTDINGKVDFSLPKMESGAGTTLAADVAQTFTTPPNFNRAFFSYSVGTNVFVAIDNTAAEFGVTPEVTNSELNPSIRQLNIEGGQTISVISPTTAYVGIRYDLGQPGAKG
jgi:hypothetical protein